MENTEPKKSVDDAFHERFGRPLKNGSEVKFTAGGDTMLVSEKEILDFIHSYTASRGREISERDMFILGWRERDWPEDFDRKTAQMIADKYEQRFSPPKRTLLIRQVYT